MLLSEGPQEWSLVSFRLLALCESLDSWFLQPHLNPEKYPWERWKPALGTPGSLLTLVT